MRQELLVHNLLWGHNYEAIENDESGGNVNEDSRDADDGQETFHRGSVENETECVSVDVCEAISISSDGFVLSELVEE